MEHKTDSDIYIIVLSEIKVDFSQIQHMSPCIEKICTHAEYKQKYHSLT